MHKTSRRRSLVLWPFVASLTACDADDVAGSSVDDGPEWQQNVQDSVDGTLGPADLCGQLLVLLGTDGPDNLAAGPSGGCVLGLRSNDQIAGGDGSDVLIGRGELSVRHTHCISSVRPTAPLTPPAAGLTRQRRDQIQASRK